MNFGKIFRYNCQFPDGTICVWRVLAESNEKANIKLNEFIDYCANNCMDVPTHVECVTKEDNLILY